MPFKSKSQQRWMFANDPEMAKRWADHTPNIKKLPEKVKHKEEKKITKESVYNAFISRCHSLGINDPEQIADMAEKYAFYMEKIAENGIMHSIGEAIGNAGILGPIMGSVVLPAAAGYGVGGLAAKVRNQSDIDEAKVMALHAEANAYRRRAVEAKMHAQIRKLMEDNPNKYVVMG